MATTVTTTTHALPEQSDHGLLVGVGHGDERSFEVLFERHYGWLFGVVNGITGDPSEAEEIVIDAFARLYRRPIPATSSANVRGWLYRVASNAAFNAVRARNRRTGWLRRLAGRADVREVADDPATIVAARDDAERVRRCLAALPPRQRQALSLRASGHSYSEIAAMLDVRPNSVGVILARAEKALKERYEQENRRSGEPT